MRLFVTEQNEDTKCGGCNWNTGVFYGLGNSEKEAKESFNQLEGKGLGLCAQCMVDFIVDEGFEINEPK